MGRAKDLMCDEYRDDFSYLEPPFDFNAPVNNRYPPEVTGYRLLQRMWLRLGWPSLEGRALLDFGCGVRFARTIFNLGLPIGRYVGVDVNLAAISWMSQQLARDSRFQFVHIDARNQMYNPEGTPDLPPGTLARLGVAPCDAACMHSVITHQTPAEARATFALLRRAVVNAGQLYFTAFIDDSVDVYVEADPANIGHMATYHPDALCDIVEREGWRVDRIHIKDVNLAVPAFVCTAI